MLADCASRVHIRNTMNSQQYKTPNLDLGVRDNLSVANFLNWTKNCEMVLKKSSESTLGFSPNLVCKNEYSIVKWSLDV